MLRVVTSCGIASLTMLGGCALAVGRVDASAEGHTVYNPGGGTCVRSHTETQAAPPDFHTDPITHQTVYDQRTREVSVCDETGPSSGGGSTYDTGKIKFGAWLGLMLGYSSIDARATKMANAPTVNSTGAAHDYEMEFAVRKPGHWAIALQGGYMSHAAGKVANEATLSGFTTGIRLGLYSSIVEPYVALNKAWSSLDVGDAPLYRIRAGIMRAIPFSDSYDLLPRLELQWIRGDSKAEYEVSGFAVVGALSLTY